MEMKKLASLLLAGSLALSLTACGSSGSSAGSASAGSSASASGSSGGSGGTIVLGTISPNTGSLAAYGSAVTTAVDLAVGEINAAGGINGSQVKVINADDQFDPTECLNAFNSLVSQGVGLIIGSVTSGCTSAITDAANEEQVCLLSPSATADSITTADDYVFRACYADSFQGAIAAAYAKQSGYLEALHELSDVTELTPDLLHCLIDHIEIEQGKYIKTPSGTRKIQRVKIHFKFTGSIHESAIA